MSKPKCKGCGECCKWIAASAEAVQYDLRWIEGRSGKLIGNIVFLPSVCKHLTKENRCATHNDKPEFCKDFPAHGPSAFLLNLGCKYFE